MKTLKVEDVHRAGYETFADVAERLPIFIEQVDNAIRLHSALGYRSSSEFETGLPSRRLSFERIDGRAAGTTPYPAQFRWKSTRAQPRSFRQEN